MVHRVVGAQHVSDDSSKRGIRRKEAFSRGWADARRFEEVSEQQHAQRKMPRQCVQTEVRRRAIMRFERRELSPMRLLVQQAVVQKQARSQIAQVRRRRVGGREDTRAFVAGGMRRPVMFIVIRRLGSVVIVITRAASGRHAKVLGPLSVSMVRAAASDRVPKHGGGGNSGNCTTHVHISNRTTLIISFLSTSRALQSGQMPANLLLLLLSGNSTRAATCCPSRSSAVCGVSSSLQPESWPRHGGRLRAEELAPASRPRIGRLLE